MGNSKVYSALIVAVGIMVLGLCIRLGLGDLAHEERRVTVKGLAEHEVEADKVTWPVVFQEMGDDLPKLYERMAQKQEAVRAFLMKNGVKATEMESNAPKVVDMNADRYTVNQKPYRYSVTTTITVSSRNVKLVRDIIARQGELLKQGIAIVGGDYDSQILYKYVSFQSMKPKMMQEAIANAESTARQFAENSHSELDKIVSADQGQFSIEDRDQNTPHIKKVRVVTTVTYALKK